MFKAFAPFEAPSRLQFKDPDTGYIYSDDSLRGLYTKIIQYRIQNELPTLDNLKEVVENYLCSLPENCNKCKGVEIHRSLFQYVQGGVMLLKNMYFKKFVTDKVAEKRALQCVECRFNVFPDRNAFMKWADDVAVSQVGDRHVRKDLEEKLGSCSICSCVLKAKVFVGGELPKFPEDQSKDLKSVNCWQLKLSGQE